MQIEPILKPIEFHPNQIFDETKHAIDVIAKKYLEKATDNVHHLIPVKVTGDGNCLYNSILALMNNPAVTPEELRGMYNIFSHMSLYSLPNLKF